MRRPARIARNVSPRGGAARAAGRGLLLVLALVVLRAAPAAAQIEMEGEGEPTVKRVEMVGNVAYSDGTLKSLIRTRAKSFFRPWRSAPLRSDFLRFDGLVIRDFYRRHGFLSADVESIQVVRRDTTSYEVWFHIFEGPRARVDAIDFDGPTAADEEAIRSVIPLSAGGLFDYPAVEVSHSEIDSLYAERGHVAVAIRDSVEVTGDNARVRFTIDPGPAALLRKIVVEGTQTTKPKFVSREVVLHHGDVLARSRLLRSQQRIYDSGLYSDVQFSNGDIDTATLETDLIVSVRERRLGWVDAGVGYGSTDQARLTGQVGQRNIFRDGVRFLTTARLGIRARTKPQFPYVKYFYLGDKHADLSFTRDWLLGYRVQGTIGIFADDITPIATDPVTTRTPLRDVGASAGLRYALSRWSSAGLSYEARKVTSDSTTVLTTVGRPLKHYTKNSVSATLDRDTRLDLFDPRKGSVAVATAELVGGVLQGNSQYLKFTASETKYRPLTRRLTFAVHGRAGVIASRGQGPAAGYEDTVSTLDLIPEEDRFRTGGSTTVRGYQEDEIGTQVLFSPPDSVTGVITKTDVLRGGAYILQANAEIRARIVGFLGAAAFLDGGGVWERASDISWRRIFSFSDGAGYKDMRWVLGLGVRITTPVGPVRLDYGWKMRIARDDQPDAVTGRGGFAFSLGQAF